VCGGEGCQRERHRRACARWRDRHADYDRDRRLRERLMRPEAAATAAESSAFEADPLRRLDWSAARDAVGMEVAVIVEETGRVLCGWARDAVQAHGGRKTRKSSGHGPAPARDAIVHRGGAP
jgi:hypothetical protein